MGRRNKNRNKPSVVKEVISETIKEELLQENAEEKAEDNKNEVVEEKPEDTKEEKTEEKAAETEEKPEEKKEDIPEEKAEEKPDESEDKKEEKAEDESKDDKKEKSEDKPDEKSKEAEVKDENKKEDESNKEKSKEDKYSKYEKFYIQEPYIDSSVDKHKKRRKVLKWVGISLLTLVCVAYFAGVFYFSNHFDTDTSINGYDISYKSIEEVEAIFEEEFSGYELTVQFKDGEEKILCGHGELEYSLEESISDIKKKQNPFIWFVNLFYEDDYTVNYVASYNEDALEEYVSTFKAMDSSNMIPSKDARVRLSEGEVVVIPDETGTELDTEKVMTTITTALDSYSNSVNIDANECYIKADITADSETIADIVAEAEDFLNIEAYYDFKGYKVQITKEELCTMAYIDSWGDVEISKSNVELFAMNFAEKYSTAYTERKFKTNDNRTILIYGGYFGWVLDGEAEGEELYQVLLAKEDFIKEPVCERQGYTYCDLNDIGDTYVEIDLADQHVYYYENGILKMDSDCVTGHLYGMKTPGGLYSLKGMESNTYLVGADYRSFVYYWMPFNGGIGLHDATWRGTFGGDIYTYDGSHGCVNLPLDFAGELYQVVEIGMPIVCYWDDEVVEVD